MKSKLKLKRYLLFLPLLPLGTLSLANTYLLQDHNTLTPYTPFTTPLIRTRGLKAGGGYQVGGAGPLSVGQGEIPGHNEFGSK